MVEEEDEVNDAEEEEEEAEMEEDSALVDQGDKQMLVPKEEGNNSNGNSGTLVRNPPMFFPDSNFACKLVREMNLFKIKRKNPGRGRGRRGRAGELARVPPLPEQAWLACGAAGGDGARRVPVPTQRVQSVAGEVGGRPSPPHQWDGVSACMGGR